MRDKFLSSSEEVTLQDTIKEYRFCLHNSSWFMRNLNGCIAREVNKEEDCTGRFCDGRFKLQTSLDESVILPVWLMWT
jgi:hypothetical protein